MSFILQLLSYRPVRFVVAGGSTAVIHIGIVYLFTSIFEIWYVVATTVGFLSAVAASFTLQKFFAFQDHRTDKLVVQSSFFFTIAVFNLILNNMLLVAAVEYLSFVPITAQIIVSGIIAVWSYIAYSFIFKKSNTSADKDTE